MSPPASTCPAADRHHLHLHGVEVDADAQVRREDGAAFHNVYAAGEIMSGNILSTGYVAGFGLTIGTVWGRIAGRTAARNATR